MQNVQIEHFNRISFVFGQKSISFAYAHTHITVSHENIVEKHNKSNRSNDNVASQLFLQFPTFLQSHQRFIKNTKHFMSHSAFIEQKVTDPSRISENTGQNVFQFIRKDFCHWQRVPPSSSINVKRHQEIRCFCHASLLFYSYMPLPNCLRLPALRWPLSI